MKIKSLLFSFFFFTLIAQAQTTVALKDSVKVRDSVTTAIAKEKQDSIEKVLLAKLTYPLIKSSKWSGVIPVKDADEKPDLSHPYNLLLEVTIGSKDSVEAKDINASLAEVGRVINLHIAAGIPKNKLHLVVVAHGGILRSFYNNAAYQKKYKINNPNIALFNELLAAGVTFIACGQAMNFLDIDKSQLLPWVKVSLSAQIVLTDYQLRGYVHRYIDPR